MTDRPVGLHSTLGLRQAATGLDAGRDLAGRTIEGAVGDPVSFIEPAPTKPDDTPLDRERGQDGV